MRCARGDVGRRWGSSSRGDSADRSLSLDSGHHATTLARPAQQLPRKQSRYVLLAVLGCVRPTRVAPVDVSRLSPSGLLGRGCELC